MATGREAVSEYEEIKALAKAVCWKCDSVSFGVYYYQAGRIQIHCGNCAAALDLSAWATAVGKAKRYIRDDQAVE